MKLKLELKCSSRGLESFNQIAFVVLGLVVLSGLGVGGFMLFGGDDLAGAATEPKDVPHKDIVEKETIKKIKVSSILDSGDEDDY